MIESGEVVHAGVYASPPDCAKRCALNSLVSSASISPFFSATTPLDSSEILVHVSQQGGRARIGLIETILDDAGQLATRFSRQTALRALGLEPYDTASPMKVGATTPVALTGEAYQVYEFTQAKGARIASHGYVNGITKCAIALTEQQVNRIGIQVGNGKVSAELARTSTALPGGVVGAV